MSDADLLVGSLYFCMLILFASCVLTHERRNGDTTFGTHTGNWATFASDIPTFRSWH
jgi:hypothetical protein